MPRTVLISLRNEGPFTILAKRLRILFIFSVIVIGWRMKLERGRLLCGLIYADCALAATLGLPCVTAEIEPGAAGFAAKVAPFFQANGGAPTFCSHILVKKNASLEGLAFLSPANQRPPNGSGARSLIWRRRSFC